MFKVTYTSIDHCRIARSFKTLAAARKFAVLYVGEHPEMGSHYAVSGDGVGKVTVKGCTLAELFAGKATKADDEMVLVYTDNIDGADVYAPKSECELSIVDYDSDETGTYPSYAWFRKVDIARWAAEQKAREAAPSFADEFPF